jgi:MFS transporter, DHA1 family, multidrug resistance protein
MSIRSDRVGELYRDNRALVWLSLVIFVNQLGFGSIVPVVPLYAKSFGVSQSAIGLTIGVYGLARFLTNLPAGQLADRMGRRWTLVLGEVVTAVGNLLCGMSGSYEQFLLFRFVAGAGAAMVVTLGQVSVADIATPSNRGRTMAIYQGVFLFAVGIGPLPGGLLAEQFGLNMPFYVFAALGVIAAALAFDKVPETRGMSERREALAGAAAPVILPYLQQLRTLTSQLGFMLVSLVTFVQFFARTGAIFAVVPVMAAVKLGLSPDQIGLSLTVVSLANLAMVYFSGLLVDRFGRKTVIVPSTLLTGLSMASFVLAPSFGWLLASCAFWGVAGGISGPAPAAYAADMAPSGMNAVTMSSYRMMADLGYVVGPMLLGWLADVSGNETSLLVTAVMFLVSGMLFALFAPESTRMSAGVVTPAVSVE